MLSGECVDGYICCEERSDERANVDSYIYLRSGRLFCCFICSNSSLC